MAPRFFGTVLFIEDDPDQAYMYTRVTSQMDCVDATVLPPADAMEWLARHARQVAGIVCDVKMEEMPGLDVLETVRQTWPWLVSRFVFCSNFRPTDDYQGSGVPLFRKPSSSGDIEAMLESLTKP